MPSPSGSQFLPYRRQTALRSVAADEPHAATIGSTLRANELRRSGGKDSRTTLPPVCGSFHSHSLLRSLPMPTTCRARTEKCKHISLMPQPQAPMSMCRSAAAASVALNRRKKVYHLRFSARYGRRLPERIRFLRCKSGVGLLRRADSRLRSLQKPMLNKFSGNAYGLPAHTLAPQSFAPLPALHRTSTSPYHKIKPQSEFEARFCLAVVGLPTILKSGSQSAPPKPPLRFGSSSHIGDFTAHRPAYSARRRPKLQFCSVGRGGAASAGTRG